MFPHEPTTLPIVPPVDRSLSEILSWASRASLADAQRRLAADESAAFVTRVETQLRETRRARRLQELMPTGEIVDAEQAALSHVHTRIQRDAGLIPGDDEPCSD